MWKKLTNKLLNRSHRYSSVQEYCLSFLSLIDNKYSIIPLDLLQGQLNSTPNIISLTNISSAISDHLNNGNVEIMISFIYHFFDIDFSEDYYQKPLIDNKKVAYEEIFNSQSQFYIYKAFYFQPDILLNKDMEDNFYLFLFLFFLPCSKYDNLLKHPKDNLPLLSYCSLTNTAFDMILFLMQELAKEDFSNLCKDYNLNLMLIEDFMNNAGELYGFNPNTDWYEILPLYKITILIDYGCDFSRFTELRDKKNFFTFPDLAIILRDYEKEYHFDKLNKKIPNKPQQQYKLIKI